MLLDHLDERTVLDEVKARRRRAGGEHFERQDLDGTASRKKGGATHISAGNNCSLKSEGDAQRQHNLSGGGAAAAGGFAAEQSRLAPILNSNLEMERNVLNLAICVKQSENGTPTS